MRFLCSTLMVALATAALPITASNPVMAAKTCNAVLFPRAVAWIGKLCGRPRLCRRQARPQV
jgi:hypothetical protein